MEETKDTNNKKTEDLEIEEEKKLLNSNNPDVFTIAYLSFLENINLTTNAKIVYLHLKARAGINGFLWIDKGKLWISLGLKERKYYDYIRELEDKQYIKQYARYSKCNGARKSNVIIVYPLDPYTGTPINNSNVDNIKQFISQTINNYVKSVIEKNNPNAVNNFEGYVITDIPKRKEKVINNIHIMHNEDTHMQQMQMVVNAENAVTPPAENAITPSAVNADTPPHQTQLRVNASGAELNNINTNNNININNINTELEKEEIKKDMISSPINFEIINDQALAIIKNNISKIQYNTWIISTVKYAKIEEGNIYIPCPNKFTMDTLQLRYNEVIEKVYKSLRVNFKNVVYQISEKYKIS